MVVAQGERRGILPHDLDLDTGAGVRIANFRKSAFRGPGPDQSVFRIGQQRIDGIRSQPVRSRIGNGAPAADIVTNQPVHRGDPDVAATVLAQIEEITITAGNVFGNPRQEQQTFPETASGQFVQPIDPLLGGYPESSSGSLQNARHGIARDRRGKILQTARTEIVTVGRTFESIGPQPSPVINEQRVDMTPVIPQFGVAAPDERFESIELRGCGRRIVHPAARPDPKHPRTVDAEAGNIVIADAPEKIGLGIVFRRNHPILGIEPEGVNALRIAAHPKVILPVADGADRLETDARRQPEVGETFTVRTHRNTPVMAHPKHAPPVALHETHRTARNTADQPHRPGFCDRRGRKGTIPARCRSRRFPGRLR